MAKRLSEKQKEEILKKFREGFPIHVLAEEFNCTKLTICRNLKKNLGEKSYEDILKNNNSDYSDPSKEKLTNQILEKGNYLIQACDSSFVDIHRRRSVCCMYNWNFSYSNV